MPTKRKPDYKLIHSQECVYFKPDIHIHDDDDDDGVKWAFENFYFVKCPKKKKFWLEKHIYNQEIKVSKIPSTFGVGTKSSYW